MKVLQLQGRWCIRFTRQLSTSLLFFEHSLVLERIMWQRRIVRICDKEDRFVLFQQCRQTENPYNRHRCIYKRFICITNWWTVKMHLLSKPVANSGRTKVYTIYMYFRFTSELVICQPGATLLCAWPNYCLQVMYTPTCLPRRLSGST